MSHPLFESLHSKLNQTSSRHRQWMYLRLTPGGCLSMKDLRVFRGERKKESIQEETKVKMSD